MELNSIVALYRRNVRLKKGFANVEKAPFGGEKLRIPTLLYVEKMRTQSRFNVSIIFFVFCKVGYGIVGIRVLE